MARKIIILENTDPDKGSLEPNIYRYAMWLDIPVARQPYFANATATSVVSKGPNAATSGEITAIQSGAILEKVESINVVGMTLVQIEAALVTRFNAAQAFLNSNSGNPYDHYGSSWDGTSWTANVVG